MKKKDFSRYFSGNPFTRMPLHKMVMTLCGVLVVLVAVGAGLAAAAMQGGAPSSLAASLSAVLPSPTPTATPAPTPTPVPAKDVRMDIYTKDQNMSIALYCLTPDAPAQDPSQSEPAPAPTPMPPETPSEQLAPLTGVEVTITLVDENGNLYPHQLDQATGQLHLEDLWPGTYIVRMEPAEGFNPPEQQSVFIPMKVVYKPEPEKVKDQVKSDSEASAEDTKPAESEPSSAPVDTVRYAESSVDVHTEDGTVYLLEGNVQDGYLLYSDGSVSPYIAVTEEKNGNTYIVEARLEGSEAAACGVQLLSASESVPFSESIPSSVPESVPSSVPGEELPDTVLLYEDGEIRDCEMFQLESSTVPLEEHKTITGWYTDPNSGRQYYYDPDTHEPVTGQQIIQGEIYTFLDSGERKTGEMRGIDVSKYQTGINWQEVKDSGIDFVIIRAGYRGWGTGALVEDPMLASHVAGARSVGLNIGLYFYSQAVNEQEAVDEASFVVGLIQKYGIPLSMPVYYDTEMSDGRGNGRADVINTAQRTANAVAFCETVRNAGCIPGVYSYPVWFTNNLDFSRLSHYNIWVAHYAAQLKFPWKHDMWQYTSKGSVPGVPGGVDMNLM